MKLDMGSSPPGIVRHIEFELHWLLQESLEQLVFLPQSKEKGVSANAEEETSSMRLPSKDLRITSSQKDETYS